MQVAALPYPSPLSSLNFSLSFLLSSCSPIIFFLESAADEDPEDPLSDEEIEAIEKKALAKEEKQALKELENEAKNKDNLVSIIEVVSLKESDKEASTGAKEPAGELASKDAN